MDQKHRETATAGRPNEYKGSCDTRGGESSRRATRQIHAPVVSVHDARRGRQVQQVPRIQNPNPFEEISVLTKSGVGLGFASSFLSEKL